MAHSVLGVAPIKVCLGAKIFYHMIHSHSGPLKDSSNTKISDWILMKCNKSTKLFIFITFKPLYNNNNDYDLYVRNI